MKKMLAFAAALSLAVPSISVAQDKVEKRDAAGYYYVVHYELKPGSMDKFTEMTKKLMAIDAKVGNKSPMVFNAMTGEWDVIAIFPVEDGLGSMEYKYTPRDVAFNKALLESMGGDKEKVQAMWKEFGGLIEKSESELVYMRK